ncbi:MAG: sensor domain-containing diguanylate cyclase [Candidatus Omnitrophica bacterium]|nr:sensor domain-containing diguanylate cyclase [Candidatus Omnitrophota bacterium]
MTEKPKKQSFNFLLFLAVVLAVILVVFFVFATSREPGFFLFLSAGLTLILGYLFPLYLRLKKKQGEVDLQIQNLEEKWNLLEAEIAQEKSAIAAFREKIIRYDQLKGLTERLTLCLSLEDASGTLSREVNRLFGEKERAVLLYFFQPKTGELGISSSYKGGARVNIKLKKGDIFDQWVVRVMQSLLIEDTRNDYRFDVEKVAGERPIRSLMSVPLLAGKKAVGILRVDSPRERDFTTEDLRFLTTIADIGAVAVENAQLYERVEQLAIRDGLTGLYLRRYLLDRLAVEANRQLRRKGQLSFLMFDLDKFKQYNDKFGHVAGDIVLRSVGMILADFFKQPGNLVCRYGGEEFSVLLPDCSKSQAAELAEEIRRKIADQTIVLRREKTRVSVSVGIASFPKDAINPKELIHKADMALYQAKENGRNRVCLA